MSGNPTHAEAETMLRDYVLSVQRVRSTMVESLVGDDEENPVADAVLEDLQPWLFGPRSILPVAEKLLTEAEQTGTVGPADLMNLYQVLHFVPALAMHFSMWKHPAAFDFAWLQGWSGAPHARQTSERRYTEREGGVNATVATSAVPTPVEEKERAPDA